MEFFLDSANLEAIRAAVETLPISGVTSNPTILRAEGKIDFFEHFRQIRDMIGLERPLHIQVASKQAEKMIKEAERIVEQIDERVYIKIPATQQGLRAMKVLKERGIGVTATAIYTQMQGFLSIACGADYIAPYVNRMENLDMQPFAAIEAFAKVIGRTAATTKILAASFKNVQQINQAIRAGVHCVTLTPQLLQEALDIPAVERAVDRFADHWREIFGDTSIDEISCR